MKNAPSKSGPIGENEVSDFIFKTSSFAFEMAVVKELRLLGLRADHSGNYSDPVTGLSRQFDIRCSLTRNFQTVELSVECKKISADFPLLISCSPRKQNETYLSAFRGTIGGDSADILNYAYMYRAGEQVGRAIEQYTSDFNRAKARDEYYSKFAQSIQSSVAGIANTKRIYASLGQPGRALILPCLVVPDDMLWLAKYHDDGKLIGSPSRTEHISVFIGFEGILKPIGDGSIYRYAFSHLELMTFSGIKKFWNDFLKASTDFAHLFQA